MSKGLLVLQIVINFILPVLLCIYFVFLIWAFLETYCEFIVWNMI